MYERLIDPIIDIAVETWRFRRVFEKAVNKFDCEENSRFYNHFSWYAKKVDSALQKAGFHIVDVEGRQYDIGIAVKPINIGEFSTKDKLIIAQMLEPIVMDSKSVIRMGTVILRREE